MTFSPELEARFAKLLEIYPPGRTRSAVVPMLLYAQDEVGHISNELIEEVARRCQVQPLQVDEVVGYYSMLHRKPLGKCHVQVCTNISCLILGGEELYEHASKTLGIGNKEVTPDGQFSLEEVECMGACSWAPAIQLNYDFHHHVTPEKLDQLLADVRKRKIGSSTSRSQTLTMLYNEPSPLEVKILTKRFGLPNSESLDTYLATDGYKAFLKAIEMTPEQIIEEVKASALRGRGGAGFPTGLKWSFVPRTSPKPKYIIINADESEPGTCKDRLLMENDPHQLIEGILIAGRAVDSHKGYIYIRGEYRYLIEAMDRAIAEAYSRGYLGKNIQGTGFDFDLYTHTGAGAYECGEETALLDSIEGKRGIPRMKPPFPGRGRRVAIPHAVEQCRDLFGDPGHHPRRRRGVRGSGPSEERRNAPGLPLRAHQQTRRV